MTSRNKRYLMMLAAAVLAVVAVIAPSVVQNAYADSAKSDAAAAEARQTTRALHETFSHKAAQESFNALSIAQITVQQVQGRADVGALNDSIDALQANFSSKPSTLHKLSAAANTAVFKANVEATAHDAAVAKAAAEAKAKAEAAAAALAAANTPSGARATARSMMASKYGWGDDQYQCLDSLWTRESNWNYQAYNASGATGIPQALPGSKMASVGSDWATNAATQIAWGLGYIAGSYGTPCAAWGHSESYNWY